MFSRRRGLFLALVGATASASAMRGHGDGTQLQSGFPDAPPESWPLAQQPETLQLVSSFDGQARYKLKHRYAADEVVLTQWKLDLSEVGSRDWRDCREILHSFPGLIPGAEPWMLCPDMYAAPDVSDLFCCISRELPCKSILYYCEEARCWILGAQTRGGGKNIWYYGRGEGSSARGDEQSWREVHSAFHEPFTDEFKFYRKRGDRYVLCTTKMVTTTHRRAYKPGDLVEVKYKDDKWYPATIRDPSTFPSPCGPVAAHQLLVEYDDTPGAGGRVPVTKVRPLFSTTEPK